MKIKLIYNIPKTNQYRNLSQEEKNKMFIEKAQALYGDKYDYSKANYSGMNNHITIICPEHGEFLQKPSKHLRGHGCPECGYSKKYNRNQNT